MKYKYIIDKRYADTLTGMVEQIAKRGVSPKTESIYRGRNTVFRMPLGDKIFIIKEFHRPAFFNSLIYTNLRKSKARRSYEHAQELLNRGIDTPTPVAWIEQKAGGRLDRSYYICEESPCPNNLRDWQEWNPDLRDRVLKAYARHMRDMHIKGIQHHDLSAGNVLWREDQAGNIHFQIIDLNRMTLYDRPLSEKEALSNFRNINLLPVETRRLARFYAKAASWDEDRTASRAEQVLLSDRRRKRRLHAVSRKKK